MKQGRSLVELAQELQRRSEAKEDFIAPTQAIQMVGTENNLVISDREYSVTDHTHRQVGTWANVPAKYYDKMRVEAPELLNQNINHWFGNQKSHRMVRTLDGTARAFLSNRYRRIDNEDIAEQVLPVLLDSGNFAEVVSTEVTERKMYIKALFPRTRADVVGDEVQAGVVISNSEIGLGSLYIQPLIYTLSCLNGMISMDYGLSRYHVGRKVEGDGENAFSIFQDETVRADDKALMLKVRDIVNGMANRQVFNKIVDKLREAKQGIIADNPVNTVEVLAKSYSLSDGEKTGVLESLIRGGDYSKYGVLNAVTNVANNHESYDRATELEALGGKILDLPKSEWKVLAEAA